ncbi:CD59 glycoprotein [Lissotriton helveticus]
MARVQMSGVGVLLVVSAVLLGLFGSGYALKCFNCGTLSDKVCIANITCPTTDDACLLVKSGTSRLTSCIPYNSCNSELIAKKYSLSNFSFNCCQKELCNSGGMTVVNKAIFSLVTMLALVWICF